MPRTEMALSMLLRAISRLLAMLLWLTVGPVSISLKSPMTKFSVTSLGLLLPGLWEVCPPMSMSLLTWTMGPWACENRPPVHRCPSSVRSPASLKADTRPPLSHSIIEHKSVSKQTGLVFFLFDFFCSICWRQAHNGRSKHNCILYVILLPAQVMIGIFCTWSLMKKLHRDHRLTLYVGRRTNLRASLPMKSLASDATNGASQWLWTY